MDVDENTHAEWYADPQLRLLFQRWTKLLDTMEIMVDERTWLSFMDHLTQVDRFPDYCKRCRRDYPDVAYEIYGPLAVSADGSCRYECVNGHRWSTFYSAAKGLELPRRTA